MEKKCPEGKILNKLTNRCNKVKTNKKKECPEGKILNKLTNRCNEVKTNKKKECPEGKILNEKTGKCIQNKTKKEKKLKTTSKTKTISKKIINQPNLEQLLANPSMRKANVFQKICNENTRGFCLDFGGYRDNIKHFFNDYLLDPALVTEIKRIGSISSNGFITQIKYRRNNFHAFSVIKSSEPERDNLVYEYIVGKFVNQFVPIFPCFIETYPQIYLYESVQNFKKIKKLPKKAYPSTILKNWKEVKNGLKYLGFPNLNAITNNACLYGKQNKISIMLQHYDNFISLFDYIFDKARPNNRTFDYPNILFQVYFVLSVLCNEYTHYDLHAGNVMLFKPYIGDKYIDMHYHCSNGKIFTFSTEYIAKIIDYGRNYFHDMQTGFNSTRLYKHFCLNPGAPECTSDFRPSVINVCGTNAGIFRGEIGLPEGSKHYINPYKRNMSHDLRLVNLMKEILARDCGWHFSIQYESKYGTKEVENGTIPDVIYNVNDMVEQLKQNLNIWNAPDQYNKYLSPNWQKMGDMHVYEDRRPYRFVAMH
jgi:hypothetical protein